MATTKNPKKETAPVVVAVPPKSNVDRLLKHLKKDSLAARLVQAHRDAKQGGAVAAMRPILTARLKEVHGTLDKT
jgi:hypothetical protein